MKDDLTLRTNSFSSELMEVGLGRGRIGPGEEHHGAGHAFLSGAWGWYALILVMFLFNTVLGEELLFRGFLLPRMNPCLRPRRLARKRRPVRRIPPT